MKRIQALFFVFFFGFILQVEAENLTEKFILDWKTEYTEDTIIPYYSPNTIYKNGYLLSEHDTTNYTTTLKHYSQNGTLINSKTIEMLFWTAGEYYGSIYGLATTKDNLEEMYLVKLNENLDITKKIVVTDDTFMYAIEMRMINQNTVKDIDNKILFLGRNKIISVDKDLNNITELELTDDNYKQYFNNVYMFYNEENTDGYIYGIHIEETKLISGGQLESCLESECSYKSTIRLKDSNEIIWNQIYPEYESIEDITILKEHIIAIAMTCEDECTDAILIIDKKTGNLIQTIKDNKNYQKIKGNLYSFSTITSDDYCFSTYDLSSECGESNYEIYYIPLNIKTKTDGNGKIEVINTSRYGEEITFTVLPIKGYEVSKIVVTDSNGKVVEFKEKKFTMPNSDVTIEATFIKEQSNPETSDISIIIRMVLIISGIYICYLYFLKKNIKKSN